MPWSWLVSALSLTSFFCVACCPPTYGGQNNERPREQEILRIQQLIRDHHLEDAERQLADAAKHYPADSGFDNLAGIVEAQRGKYAEAEEYFRQAIRRAPKFTGAYLNLGRLYQENIAADPQARRKALDAYERVLEYEPANAEANYQSAVLFLQQGNYQQSIGHILRLSAEVQASAQSLSILCADYAGLGNREGAQDAAARLMATSEFSEADAQQTLAALIPGGSDDLVVALLENLQSRRPLSPALLEILGMAYERAHRLPEARATLEKSFATGRPSTELLLELARIARLEKDYEGALGYLAHARDLEPGNAAVHYSFGVACVDLNLMAEAWNSFERAVKLEPENPDYNYAAGAASSFRQDPAEAVPYFEKYLKLKPQDPRGKLAMGAALFRAKDYQAALPWLKESVGIPATATRAHYYLGAIALQEGKLDEAQSELEQALQGDPDYTDTLAELGQYYLMRKNYGQAEKLIQRALKIDPDHYEANFHLLMLYTRTKDPRQEAQAKRFEELKKLLVEKSQEFLRIVEVRPIETP